MQARLVTSEGLGGEESSKAAGPWSWIPRQRGSTAEGGSWQELLLGKGDFVRPAVGWIRARCPGERRHSSRSEKGGQGPGQEVDTQEGESGLPARDGGA